MCCGLCEEQVKSSRNHSLHTYVSKYEVVLISVGENNDLQLVDLLGFEQ